MATAVIMPRQGQSVESCIIAKWYKQKGDQIKTGDILFTYETDKATFDEEAKVDGTLLEVFFSEGDDVPVLTNVCVIGNPGESTAEFSPNSQESSSVSTQPSEPVETTQQPAAVDPVPSSTPTSSQNGDIKISPRAKNLAEKSGIDYRYANGSGPYGRIIEQDILTLKESGSVVTSAARSDYLSMGQAVAGTGLGGRITTGDIGNAATIPTTKEAVSSSLDLVPSAQPQYDEVKISNIRKVIAKAMHNSIISTCQLTLNTTFDATNILEYRKKIKENKDRLGLENITINDIVLYAVSRTLMNHKDLNANFVDDKMLLFRNVNLGVAVDTERGLMVPNIFNANTKSLNEISMETKALAKECQKGTINPDLLKSGSFTVTNLGAMGVESFTPVLNAPQTGILGVCGIVQRAREVNGEYQFYPAMGLSLTFDHRAVDGAPAARFLQELKSNLENFSILLAK